MSQSWFKMKKTLRTRQSLAKLCQVRPDSARSSIKKSQIKQILTSSVELKCCPITRLKINPNTATVTTLSEAIFKTPVNANDASLRLTLIKTWPHKETRILWWILSASVKMKQEATTNLHQVWKTWILLRPLQKIFCSKSSSRLSKHISLTRSLGRWRYSTWSILKR